MNQTAVDEAQLRHDIEACAASQQRLSEHLRSLNDVDPASPSMLPDWSVGHVLTHIARNADGVLRMLDGLGQYWRGLESRNADIALGAGRTWAELLDDLDETSDAVTRKLRSVDDWTGVARATVHDRPKSQLPEVRRREVEVHHADLGLGYDFADMPTEYVRRELRTLERMWRSRQPMGMTNLPDAVLRRPEHERLAWLFGRVELAGVGPARVY